MPDLTWLQAQVPRPDWEVLNKKRLELGYKWSEIILPAVEAHMANLKAKPKEAVTPAPKPAPKPATKAATEAAPGPAPEGKGNLSRTAKAQKVTKKAKKVKAASAEPAEPVVPGEEEEAIALIAGTDKPVIPAAIVESVEAENQD